MKKILVIKPDGSLIIITPNHKKYGEGKIDYSECKALQEYKLLGYDWKVVDELEIPQKNELESRKQMYVEDGKILIDKTWTKVLMPASLIKQKEIDYLTKKINEEFLKDGQNKEELSNLIIKKDYIKNIDVKKEEKFFYKMALDNLQRSETDKSLIKSKIESKLAE